MFNVNLGYSTGLSIVVHVGTHFHNSHVLHTPALYFLYTKSPNVMLVCACASRNTNVTKPDFYE